MQYIQVVHLVASSTDSILSYKKCEMKENNISNHWTWLIIHNRYQNKNRGIVLISQNIQSKYIMRVFDIKY